MINAPEASSTIGVVGVGRDVCCSPPAPVELSEAPASRGDHHRARALVPGLIERGDVVPGMEKEQRSAGAALHPGHQDTICARRSG